MDLLPASAILPACDSRSMCHYYRNHIEHLRIVGTRIARHILHLTDVRIIIHRQEDDNDSLPFLTLG